MPCGGPAEGCFGAGRYVPKWACNSASFRSSGQRPQAVTTEQLSTLHVLSRKHGSGRKQPLMAGADAFGVVEELERAFAQLHDRYVGRGAHIERAAVIERREHARRVHGGTCNDLAERHAERDELRHDIRKIDDAGRLDVTLQSVENVSGHRPCLVAFSTVSQSK